MAGRHTRIRSLGHGFTLLELMVVVAIIALATVGVSLSLRDGTAHHLDREAQRLAALLEAGRAQSRATGQALMWSPAGEGFRFTGVPRPGQPVAVGAGAEGPAQGGPRIDLPSQWLDAARVRVQGDPRIVLGPEPVIGPQEVVLQGMDASGRAQGSRRIATDGLRPFAVAADGQDAAP